MSLLLLGLGVVTLTQNSPPVAPAGYVAVPELSDEFDGDSLDTNKWTDQPKVRRDLILINGPQHHAVPHSTNVFKVRPFAPTQQWQAQLQWEPEAVVIVTTTEVERVLPIDAGPSLMICLLNSARNAPLFYCQCQPPFFAANSDSSII